MPNFFANSQGFSKARRIAGQINSFVRCTLYRTPGIWTKLLITTTTPTSYILDCISRAGILPLHIHFSIDTPTNWDHLSFVSRVFTTLGPYFNRCFSIHITCTHPASSTTFWTELRRAQFPILSKLVVDLGSESFPEILPLDAECALFDRVVELTLERSLPFWDSESIRLLPSMPARYSHIRHLCLARLDGVFALEWATFGRLIQSVPALISLSMMRVEFSGSRPANFRLRLPALVKLELALSHCNGDEFVENLEAPDLSILSISADAATDNLELFSFRDEPLLSTIGTIEISMRFSVEDEAFLGSLEKLLGRMKALTCLDLRPSAGVSPILETIAGFVSGSRPSGRLVCPNLDCIVTDDEITPQVLADILILSHFSKELVVSQIFSTSKRAREFFAYDGCIFSRLVDL